MNWPSIKLDCSRFSAVELLAFMGMGSICIILVMSCMVGLWRPMRLEVVESVYRLLDQILALIAGLLGGKALAQKDNKPTP